MSGKNQGILKWMISGNPVDDLCMSHSDCSDIGLVQV